MPLMCQNHRKQSAIDLSNHKLSTVSCPNISPFWRNQRRGFHSSDYKRFTNVFFKQRDMIKKTKHRTICLSDLISITKWNVYRKASSIITNVLVDLHINFRFGGVNRTRKCSCSILLSSLLWQVNLIIYELHNLYLHAIITIHKLPIFDRLLRFWKITWFFVLDKCFFFAFWQ